MMCDQQQFQCTECGWIGTHSEKGKRQGEPGCWDDVCPECGQIDFYKLGEPTNDN